MTLAEVYQEIEKSKKKFNWLINGLGQHGLSISDSQYISWEWIKDNYHVHDPCDHTDVSDITSCVVYEEELGNHYTGYCNQCERMVGGFISMSGKKKPWSVDDWNKYLKRNIICG